MKRVLFFFLCGLSVSGHSALNQASKLVVIISIDQLRYDYLARFDHAFSQGGFRYFLDHGANFTNANYEHGSTITGPGHAVLLSGTYANQNGIVQNNWYDRLKKRSVYCVEDETATIIGADGRGRSPALFIGSTFGDELRINTGFHAKVVSVSLKDRAAVLMGGKLASAVYWLADSNFITSSYYMEDLPEWVEDFNSSGTVSSYFGKYWTRALPGEYYRGLDRDNAPYEDDRHGLGRVFPHRITGEDPDAITKSYFEAFRTSPFGNETVSLFAQQAVLHEKLGQRGTTDLLCIGFSSNDYVGHRFGPHSHEVFDLIVRMDSLLADLLAFLDTHVGLERCTFVISSDHGSAPIPEYLLAQNHGADAGRVLPAAVRELCEGALRSRFGIDGGNHLFIERIQGRHVHLDIRALHARGIPVEDAAETIVDSLLASKEVAYAYTFTELTRGNPATPIGKRIQNSFFSQRSGHVVFSLKPFYLFSSGKFGTSHGSPYSYDTHVPLILMGRGFRPGTYTSAASPADVVPTLSALHGIEFPALHTGRILHEALSDHSGRAMPPGSGDKIRK
jgi:predicted AlkP superfamily pyrophosphatase or phosphodiesterase